MSWAGRSARRRGAALLVAFIALLAAGLGLATPALAGTARAGLPAAGLPAAGLPVAGLPAAEPRLIVSDLVTDGYTVHFVLNARDLPDAASLDPAAVRVKLDGAELATQASVSTQTTDVPPRAVMVVLDLHAGAAEGYLPAVQSVMTGLLDALPPDVAVGLVVSAGPPTVLAPAIQRGPVEEDVAALGLAGATPVVEAVNSAIVALAVSGLAAATDRRVVIITDAGSTAPSAFDPTIATLANQADAPIDVLAVGGSGGGTGLAKLAQLSGGNLREATSATAAAAGASVAQHFPAPVRVSVRVPDHYSGKAVRLDIRVDGLDLAASVPVTIAAVAPPSHPAAAPSRLLWVPTWAGYAVSGILFLALILAVFAIGLPSSRKQARIKQIAHFGPARALPAGPKPESESAGNVIARTALAATASLVRSGGMEQRISLRLARAGMSMRPQEWVLLRICVMIVLGTLFFAFARIPGALIGVAVGWLLTVLYQTLLVERRAAAFAEQLPDAIQLLIGSLRSGFSLPQALDSLVRESPEPVGAEFGRALAEHRLGADISDALERVGQRTRSEDIGWAVMAVRIQREVGGNLAEVLQTTVDTMRERARLRRHVRSLSAEGRLSGWVLIGLPIGLGAFMFLYRRSYVAPLITHSVGRMLLVVGVLLLTTGIVWMSRVIKVDA